MSNSSQYVIQTLKDPFTPEMSKKYSTFAKRILWIDGDMVPGAFQMNCAWYIKPNSHISLAHIHTTDEIIGFFGSDVNNPSDMGGELEFWMEDEKYLMTESFLVFVPAGVKHCPLKINRIERPIFHLGASPSRNYVKKDSR